MAEILSLSHKEGIADSNSKLLVKLKPNLLLRKLTRTRNI